MHKWMKEVLTKLIANSLWTECLVPELLHLLVVSRVTVGIPTKAELGLARDRDFPIAFLES